MEHFVNVQEDAHYDYQVLLEARIIFISILYIF